MQVPEEKLLNIAPALRAFRAGDLTIGLGLRQALSGRRHKEVITSPLSKSCEQKVLSPRAEEAFRFVAKSISTVQKN